MTNIKKALEEIVLFLTTTERMKELYEDLKIAYIHEETFLLEVADIGVLLDLLDQVVED